jgi:adenosylcobinamide-GDP ribazoletransferase
MHQTKDVTMVLRDIALRLMPDLARAVALLTRLPVRAEFTDGAAARAAWAYPVVGVIAATLAVGAGYGLCLTGVPVVVAALCGIAVQVVVTGAMHEDGLADTVDGFWGGWTVARRLEIMKDSHIGTYGVIALIISLGLRATLWTAVLPVAPLALIAAAALSRSAMPCVMAALPHARDTGLSRTTGRPPVHVAIAGCVLASFIALVLTGGAAIGMAMATAALTVAVILVTKAKIGGQTGDILGATQVLSEIAALMAVTMYL